MFALHSFGARIERVGDGRPLLYSSKYICGFHRFRHDAGAHSERNARGGVPDGDAPVVRTRRERHERPDERRASGSPRFRCYRIQTTTRLYRASVHRGPVGSCALLNALMSD